MEYSSSSNKVEYSFTISMSVSLTSDDAWLMQLLKPIATYSSHTLVCCSMVSMLCASPLPPAPLQNRMVFLLRREPGLLSWNASTLVNRMMAVSQMLKLPPDLTLTLLAYNRPLLSSQQQLPHKLQLLQRVLGLTGGRQHDFFLFVKFISALPWNMQLSLTLVGQRGYMKTQSL